ncbi:hypothetical protein BY996DRAFT_6408619 [Phakopsora pachyrhizi]|uniref:Expressed protein n=1 Tax=Phakopsora pachyrhizi TaxID=170000 RepID=A0AAV0BQB7_PHAPC|nr:hypothetical protein BY996DRAFT_6408619 [Phakopsora pachyrhizi]CAH7688236.1 expressed protein [Phakopsora pachyrhizi]
MLNRHKHSRQLSGHHGRLLIQHSSHFASSRELVAKRSLLIRGTTQETFNNEQPPRASEIISQGAFYPTKSSLNPQLARQESNPEQIVIQPGLAIGPTSVPTASSIQLISTATPTTTGVVQNRVNSAPAVTLSKSSPVATSSCSLASCRPKNSLPAATNLSSSTPASSSGNQDFFSSISSNPAGIFLITLIGILTLGITAAILSFALRRWCNRRRKSVIDEDTWKFLDTPKEFYKGLKPEEDALSVKDSEKSFEPNLKLAPLEPTLSGCNTPSNPFKTHIQQQNRRNTLAVIPEYNTVPQFHHCLDISTQDQRRMSCLVGGKTMDWMNSSVSQPRMFGGMILAPYGSNIEAIRFCEPTGPVPELMLQKPSEEGAVTTADSSPPVEIILPSPDPVYISDSRGSQIQSRLALTPTQKAQFRTSMVSPLSPRGEDLNDMTRTQSMILSKKLPGQPLSREISQAFSEISTTVETLLERATVQKTDLRANLMVAIMKDKGMEREDLEVLQPKETSLLNLSREMEKDSGNLLPPLPSKDEMVSCWSPSGVLSGSYGFLETPNFYNPIEKLQPATPRPLEYHKRSQSSDEENHPESTSEDMSRQKSDESYYPFELLSF